MAESDLARQNTFAGMVPNISIKQIGSRPLQCSDLGNTRERCHNGLDARNLCIGKSTFLLRRPRYHVHRIVCENQRVGEVVGCIFVRSSPNIENSFDCSLPINRRRMVVLI